MSRLDEHAAPAIGEGAPFGSVSTLEARPPFGRVAAILAAPPFHALRRELHATVRGAALLADSAVARSTVRAASLTAARRLERLTGHRH